MTNDKTMIQAKARKLAVELILANAPSSVELYRRGLSVVHGEHVVDALAEELNYVRTAISNLEEVQAETASNPAQADKTRPGA